VPSEQRKSQQQNKRRNRYKRMDDHNTFGAGLFLQVIEQ
jgi:hypothetical protein